MTDAHQWHLTLRDISQPSPTIVAVGHDDVPCDHDGVLEQDGTSAYYDGDGHGDPSHVCDASTVPPNLSRMLLPFYQEFVFIVLGNFIRILFKLTPQIRFDRKEYRK